MTFFLPTPATTADRQAPSPPEDALKLVSKNSDELPVVQAALATEASNPQIPAVNRANPRATDFGVQSYIPAILGALKNTLRHILFVKPVTLQYPEVKEVYPAGSRGEHYLKRDEAGRVRCVACYLCAVACPAECIHIEAAEAPADWTDRDKYPARFEIDMLRCIYCGMCEEACPCDAIALSTVHCISSVTREEKIYDCERLLAGGDQIGEMGASRFPTEGSRRGAWLRDRELPPIPDHEREMIEGRLDWQSDPMEVTTGDDVPEEHESQ